MTPYFASVKLKHVTFAKSYSGSTNTLVREQPEGPHFLNLDGILRFVFCFVFPSPISLLRPWQLLINLVCVPSGNGHLRRKGPEQKLRDIQDH